MRITSDGGLSVKRCHLLEIPPEIRLQIYEHVWDERLHCTFDIENINTVELYCPLPPGHSAALL